METRIQAADNPDAKLQRASASVRDKSGYPAKEARLRSRSGWPDPQGNAQINLEI